MKQTLMSSSFWRCMCLGSLGYSNADIVLQGGLRLVSPISGCRLTSPASPRQPRPTLRSPLSTAAASFPTRHVALQQRHARRRLPHPTRQRSHLHSTRPAQPPPPHPTLRSPLFSAAAPLSTRHAALQQRDAGRESPDADVERLYTQAPAALRLSHARKVRVCLCGRSMIHVLSSHEYLDCLSVRARVA